MTTQPRGLLAVATLKGSKLLLLRLDEQSSVVEVGQLPRSTAPTGGARRAPGPDGALDVTTSNGEDDEVLRVSPADRLPVRIGKFRSLSSAPMTTQDPRDQAASDPQSNAALPEHPQTSADEPPPTEPASGFEDEPSEPTRQLLRQERPARPAGSVEPILSAEGGPVPGQVTTSLGLWIASFIAGLVAAAVAAVRSDSVSAELEGRLQELITAEQLAVSPEQVGTVAEFILLSTLGAIGVLIVLQLLLVATMRNRCGWARGVLLVTVVLSAPAVLVAQDLVSSRTQLGFLLQGTLMIIASILMFLPDSNAWFRGRIRS